MSTPHPQKEIEVYKLVETGEMEIDQDGTVWRRRLRHGDRWRKSFSMTQCPRRRAEMQNVQGYLQVRVMIHGKRHHAAAHRLVWLHFNGTIPQGITINHRNGVKTDNRPENLELASYSQQRTHAIQVLGARHHDVKGSNHPKTKLTEANVMEIRAVRKAGGMVKDIAAHWGMKPKAITAITTGRTWRHIPL